MARLTGQAAYAKWSQRVSGAQSYYVDGVNSGKDWQSAALAAGPARDAALIQAINAGAIDAGIKRVSTTAWRQITSTKGAQNWSQAVSSPAVQAKYLAGYAKLEQMLNAGDSAVAGIPRGGFAQNMQRATAYATAVHQTAQALKIQ
jgi:hypothetical protein